MTPGEKKSYPDRELKEREIRPFYKLVDVWNYVLDEHIGHYTVCEAECIIDQT